MTQWLIVVADFVENILTHHIGTDASAFVWVWMKSKTVCYTQPKALHEHDTVTKLPLISFLHYIFCVSIHRLCSAWFIQEGEDCLKCGLVTFVPLANLYFYTKMRESIREKRHIDGTCCNDLLVTMFCHLCSLTQLAREVEADLPGIPEMDRQ